MKTLNRAISVILLVLLLSGSAIFLSRAQAFDLNNSKVTMAEANPNDNSALFETAAVQTIVKLYVIYNDYFHNLLLAANLTDSYGNPVIGETIAFSLRRNPAPITEPWSGLGASTTDATGAASLNIAFAGFTGSYSLKARHEQHMNFSTSENIVNIVFPSGKAIHIKSDGSIDPPNAPIQKNGELYVLTDDITADSSGIVIERDGITLDGVGHSIQPLPYIVGQHGISLTGRTNAKIENVRIRCFCFDIELSNSANNTISKNKLIGSEYPTLLLGALATCEIGLDLTGSINNSISENEVTNIFVGIFSLDSSVNNIIYHNNFVNNTYKQVEADNSINMWNDSYPSGGNYWSDYNGTDLYSGPYQNETGSDGIGDTPYIIDTLNIDHYPLMNPCSMPTPKNCNLTIITTVGGTTNPTPRTYTYTANSTIYVTAIPNTGYRLDHWMLDGSTYGSANSTIVLMNENHVLEAAFAPITYTLTIISTTGGTTTPTPGNYTCVYGSSAEVTAIQDPDYSFDHWELDTVDVGSTNPYTILMVNNHTLKAVFTYSPPPLVVSISPLSISIHSDQSVTFSSTTSGGTPPYSYQWYLDGDPASGATSSTWALTPTTSGIYYVYLQVTDINNSTAQSATARLEVTSVPVGGYSFSIKVQIKTELIMPYVATILIITIFFTCITQKIKRKH